MPEAKKIEYSYKELATLLVKDANLHEGYWGIYFEFAMAGGLVPFPPSAISKPKHGESLVPAAIVPITKLGIVQFDEANDLTVDAAEVNPGET
jgi:hypothetical protein